MPNRAKQKGDRAERMIVAVLRCYGLDAYRVPLSGAVTGFKSDVEIRLGGQTLRLESKCRAAGFSRIYKWLDGNDGVVIKADRAEPLIVLSLKRFTQLVAGTTPIATEQATDKPSQSKAIEQPTQELLPATTAKVLEKDLLDIVGVKVNPMRMTTLRIADEEDLRRRDVELEADRKRFT